MSNAFKYDVFFSHASADKAAVRELAERLKKDGLKVWLDEWVIQPGDSIPLKIEQGLESSRTLLLVMSQAAFASEWVTLERHTALFRDPTNQQRRFIPLRLDDCEIKDSLKHFAYVDWRDKEDRELQKLLSLIPQKPWAEDNSTRHETKGLRQSSIVSQQIIGISSINGVDISPDGNLVAAATGNGEIWVWHLKSGQQHNWWLCGSGTPHLVRFMSNGYEVLVSHGTAVTIWNIESGRRTDVLTTDMGSVRGLHMTIDGQTLVVGSDTSMRVWDVNSREFRSLIDSPVAIRSFAVSEDASTLVSGHSDGTIRHWEVKSGECVRILHGHVQEVSSVAFSLDGKRIFSGSQDTTIKIWDLESGRCASTLEGHTSPVGSITLSPVDELIASVGTRESTLRIWDSLTGVCLITQTLVLVGPPQFSCVCFSRDGKQLAAGTKSGFIYVIDTQRALSASHKKPHFRHYTNAKVLIVGDSGVGKSGLAVRLSENIFERTDSTDAHWATQLKLSHDPGTDRIDREIWLWDFAGQADYRLIHQLFMDETALAVLVFNPQSDNPFDGLGQWDRDLAQAARRKFAKLLVAGRCDRGGLTVSRQSIEQFGKERGYQRFLQTSAKTGEGCDTLREAIEHSIDWDSIPWTASPRIFKLLKEEIIRLSDEGFTLLRMSELKQQLEMRLPDDPFTYEELKAVVGLLAGPGHVWQLEFGQFVLLHPERINSYAAAVGRTVRSHLQQIGVIHESAMLAGQLNFGDIQRLPSREEAIVLRAMHQTLVDHGFCLTQETDAGPLLVFPSYFNRERRDQIDHPRIFGTFRFRGALEELYATLVVKLHHTRAFETEELWRYAVDFRCKGNGGQVGLKMRKLGEGDAEIIAYCDAAVPVELKVTFVQYIHEHLKRYDAKATLVRHYMCRNPECEEAVSDVKAILRAREKGLTQLPCQYCFEPIPLWDKLEQELASEKYEARVLEMEATSRNGIKRESRDLMVEYHAFAIAEETSQKFVAVSHDDLGVQARIELIDLSGKPSSRCLQLQLRPAEVYKSISTNRSGSTVFEVGAKKLMDRWQHSESPVMLVHRTDDGYIRWMDVSAWLKANNKDRKTPIKTIVFAGEPFTALNLQRMRERIFSDSNS